MEIILIVEHKTSGGRAYPHVIGEGKLVGVVQDGLERKPKTGKVNVAIHWLMKNGYEPVGFQWLDKAGFLRRRKQAYRKTVQTAQGIVADILNDDATSSAVKAGLETIFPIDYGKLQWLKSVVRLYEGQSLAQQIKSLIRMKEGTKLDCESNGQAHVYTVMDHGSRYTVATRLHESGHKCYCKDFKDTAHPCKHIMAAELTEAKSKSTTDVMEKLAAKQKRNAESWAFGLYSDA